jgi:hypothetical protein
MIMVKSVISTIVGQKGAENDAKGPVIMEMTHSGTRTLAHSGTIMPVAPDVR